MWRERDCRPGPPLQLEYSGRRPLPGCANAACREHFHNVSHSSVKMGVSLAGQCSWLSGQCPHTRVYSIYLAGPPIFPMPKRSCFLYNCFRRRYRRHRRPRCHLRRYHRRRPSSSSSSPPPMVFSLKNGPGSYFQAAEKGGIANSVITMRQALQILLVLPHHSYRNA